MNRVQLNQLERNFNYRRCSVSTIMPNLVPVVLESAIKLPENFVTVCFMQKTE